ncbi:MAG: TIM barrel protein [Candidatus Limnocylindria bacterium]
MDRRTFLGTAGGAAASAALGPRVAAAALRPMTATRTRFAVNVEMWWRELPFLERLERAAALGFPAIEFWDWRSKDIPAIARRCRELGLEVAQFTAWGFDPPMLLESNHGRFVDAIDQACDTAHALDCRLMTVVGGDDQPGMTRADMHAGIAAGLRRAAPIAEQSSVTLILEPMNVRVDHPGHSLFGSAPAIRICQEVGSPSVKLNWDLYHMQLSEGDLCGHLREGFSAGVVGYLQLADTPGRHEPGTGEVRYNRVLREAFELGYRGLVGLECVPIEDERTAAQRVADADIW